MSEHEYSIRDAAERAASEVEAPKPLPSGMWRFNIRHGGTKEVVSDNPKAPIWKANYALTPLEPLEGVNPDELETFGDYSEVNNIFHESPVWRRDDEWNIVKLHTEILGQEVDGLSVTDLPESGAGYELVLEVYTDVYEGGESAKTRNPVRVEI